MPFVVVERTFDEPLVSFSEVAQRELAVQACLTRRRVTALLSYFSGDRRQLVCIYDAPDAESVREVQRESGLPYERLWSAQPMGKGLLEDPSPKSAVVAIRDYGPGIEPKDLLALFQKAQSCLGLYQVEQALSLISGDYRRSVCLYAAPDAEALRIINERYNIPCETVFRATVHSASEAEAPAV